MTTEFIDGMDYPTADIKYKYSHVYPSTSYISISALTRRSGVQTIKCKEGSFTASHTYVVYAPSRDLPGAFVGMGFMLDDEPADQFNHNCITMFMANSSTIRVIPRNNFAFKLTAFGKTVYTDPGVWTEDVFSYIEVGYVKHASTGSVTLKVAGSTVAEITGINTNTNCTLLHMGGTYGASYYFQDLYLNSGDGADNNTFLGDCRVDTLRPDSNGSTVDFIPSAGSNYQNVDESDCDEDTTYNDSTIVGDKDLYSHENLSATGDIIFATQQCTVIRKTDADEYYVKQTLKSGTTEDQGVNIHLNDGYTGYQRCFDNDPDTSTVWTESGVNGIESGVVAIAVPGRLITGVVSTCIVTSVPGILTTT